MHPGTSARAMRISSRRLRGARVGGKLRGMTISAVPRKFGRALGWIWAVAVILGMIVAFVGP